MTEPFKDFDAAIREHRREPLAFRLGGERFTALGRLPAGVFLDVLTKPFIGEDVVDFVCEVLVDDDHRRRFRTLAHRHDVEIEMDDLYEVANWLIETYTGRPTQRRSVSADSSPPTSDTSKTDSPKRAKAQSSASAPATS